MTIEEASGASFEVMDTSKDDDFLLNEGFDLLADYRRIKDEAVRRHLRAMIRAIAAGEPHL